MRKNPPKALADAITAAGGITKLAKKLGLKSHAVVNHWKTNGVPAEHCPAVEELTGVICERLRPDIKWSVIRGTPLIPAKEGK